jgi:dTDP-4-amino-4,6-dideoxygalactose transaminase
MVKQTDPLAGYLERKDEIDAAMQATLLRGWYINGQEVSSFEKEFAAFLGLSSAVGVANGTDAIHLALRALGIGPGKKVVTVSHTAVATVAAIEMTGAEAVLIDIDEDSMTLSVDALAKAAAGAQAVIAVHLYGHPCDMPAILEVARKHRLAVVEDCAQAHGATLDGRVAGSFGDIACFSFYPTKNLGALGDGGAIATNDSALAQNVRWLREYGWKERYISHLAGVNSRLDELQAALLRVKLRHLPDDNRRRRAVAAVYDQRLSGVQVPRVRPGIEHCYHQYVIRSGERERLREQLSRQEIATAIHYPQPVHLQPAYRGRIQISGSLDVTERVCRQIVSLPMYAQLPLADVERVCAAIQSAC